MEKNDIIDLRHHEFAQFAAIDRDPGPVEPDTTKSPTERYSDMEQVIHPLLLNFQSRDSDRRGEMRTPSLEVIPANGKLPAVNLHLILGGQTGSAIQAVWEYDTPPGNRSRSSTDRNEAQRESFRKSHFTQAPSKIDTSHLIPGFNRLEHSVYAYLTAFKELPEDQRVKLDILGNNQ